MQIEAQPFAFPLVGQLARETTALIVVDMQVDFVGAAGYMDRNGADLDFLRRPIAPIRRLLDLARVAGLTVVHTREAFGPDLADVQPHRLFRDRPETVIVGDMGPHGRALIKGEPGWEIVPELAPLPDEPVFDKPSYGAFGTTAIHAALTERGARHLIFVGVTTDCCIHSNVRGALDLGYETLVVEDACAAATPRVHEHAMALFLRPSGVFGTVADHETVAKVLAELAA